jgi:histidinol-phosphate/aromatic aminotransferase/cobyric acid decarboxylase-like protein
VRALAPEFRAYTWAPPSDEVARLAGIDVSQVLRFDQNTPPLPLPSTRPGTIAGALARVNGYPEGGYRTLRTAIAGYAGVEPENVVLGVGADDLILLCARAYAGPGDTIAIPAAPTYPLFRIAALLAGAATTIRSSPSPAARTTPRARSIRCLPPGRSSSTRRTSSTAAGRLSRCSTTA